MANAGIRTLDLANGCWPPLCRWGSSAPTLTSPASEPVFLTGLRISLHMPGAGSRMGGQRWAPSYGKRASGSFLEPQEAFSSPSGMVQCLGLLHGIAIAIFPPS